MDPAIRPAARWGKVLLVAGILPLLATCSGATSTNPTGPNPGASQATIVLSPSAVAFTGTVGGADPSDQTVSITEASNGGLTGLVATVSYGAGEPTGWLSTSLSATSAPSTLTLTVALSSLPAAHYTASVTITSAAAANSPQRVAVTLDIANPTLAAPSNLTATATSSSQITLAWTDNTSSEQGFRIERCGGAGCSTFTDIGGVGTDVTTFESDGLTAATTYRYRVRAWAGADTSGYSNEATATTDSAASPPAAPSALGVTVVSSSEIDLSWTDSASDEDGFKIGRCTGIICTNFTQIDSVAANVTTYQSTGLQASTTYGYAVWAYNAAGDSPMTNPAWATTPQPPPAAPSNLTATAVSATQIGLTWTDNASNETGFRLEQCAGGACTNFTEVLVIAANATSVTVNGLSASTTYRYRLRAYNGEGTSAYSNIASATTQAAASTPAAPTNLTATAVSASEIDLAWTDNSSDELGFSVEQCVGTACTNFTVLGSVGANSTTAQIVSLSAGTTYRYRVRAYNANGNSAYSNIASATTASGEQTILAQYDNLLEYSDADAAAANTVYSNTDDVVGYNYVYDAFGGYSLNAFASLLQFTLPSQIQGKTVVQATLRLYEYALPGDFSGTYEAVPVLSAWDPSTVTWNSAGNLSYGNSLAVPFTALTSTAVPLEIDVTAMVQSWANGSIPNDGIALFPTNLSAPGYTSLQAVGLESLEYYLDPTHRPQLYIKYQ